MPITEDRKIVHHYIIEKTLGAPPRYAARGEAVDNRANDRYYAEITFGTDPFTISENFLPETRGIRRPHCFIGDRRNDIAEDIIRTWSSLSIPLTTANHSVANAGYDGLKTTVHAQILRGCLYVAKLGFSALAVKLPMLEPIAAPLASAMLGGSHFFGHHAAHMGESMSVISGFKTGLSQGLSLKAAREQDCLILALIVFKNKIEVCEGSATQALADVSEELDKVGKSIHKSGSMAALMALHEFYQYLQERTIQAAADADILDQVIN